MKKNLLVITFVVVALMASGLSMFGDSGEDFKVIKNGIKGKKGNVQFLMVSVYNKAKKKNTVKIKIPLALVEMLSDCVPENINIKSDCDLDLKKILKALRKYGPMTLVEVEEDDELIKVWFE